MATNHVCASCLRQLQRSGVRQQIAKSPRAKANQFHHQRQYSLTHNLLAETQQHPPKPQSQQPKPKEETFKPLSPSEQARLSQHASRQSSIAERTSRALRKHAPRSTTEPYVAYGSTEALYQECARQCDYTIPAVLKTPPEPPPVNTADEHIGEGQGWWYLDRSQGGLGLDVTFNTWAQVMMLHIWMLTARLRAFPQENVRTWHQSLLDHFFHAAEDRMVLWHRLDSRAGRNKYLKDLLMQWRGVLLSYDEGLVRGDAVLAAALWRNVFKASEKIELKQLALVTAYVRRELKMLDKLSDEELARGDVDFGSPAALERVISSLEGDVVQQAIVGKSA